MNTWVDVNTALKPIQRLTSGLKRISDYTNNFRPSILRSLHMNMFLKGYPLEAKTAPKNWKQSVHIFWARLASFGHLGLISDPLIVSKFHNETHDPKGQENKI